MADPQSLRKAPLSLVIWITLLAAHMPAQSPNCENGVVRLPAGINGTVTICPADSTDLAIIRGQLARLNALAANSAEQQQEIAKFIKEIHAADSLLDSKRRDQTLAQSVAELLKKESGRSDTQVIRDIGMLSRQLEDLRERIDEQKQKPDGAAPTQQAIAGPLGDGIAHLDMDRANKAFEAITRIENKMDDLAARVDCASATPEAMRLAIKARALDRVVSMWRCRPELSESRDVQIGIALLFNSDLERFSTAQKFLDGLVTAGLNPANTLHPEPAMIELGSPYFYDAIYQALLSVNIEGIQWLAANTTADYWRRYNVSYLLGALQPERKGRSKDDVLHAIMILRQSGVDYSINRWEIFRTACDWELSAKLPAELRAALPIPKNSPWADPIFRETFQTAYNNTAQSARQGGRFLGPDFWVEPGMAGYWAAVARALAPDDERNRSATRARAVSDYVAPMLSAASEYSNSSDSTLRAAGDERKRRLMEFQNSILNAQE